MNSNMPNNRNQNNSRPRYDLGSFFQESQSAESQHYTYGNRGHPNSGFRRPPRGNPRHFVNPNGRGRPFQFCTPPPHNPHNWNSMNGSMWNPPPNNNKYFLPNPNLNPYDTNPFFLDTRGSYGPNENYFPFDTAEYPLHSNAGPNSNTSESSSCINTEKIVETCDSVAEIHKEPKVSKAKPLKRSNQSVRAIRNASIASRNSVDSDDAQQEGTGDKQEKRSSQNEAVTGKRIAHWIKPSNPKDEAEVRRLVTEFSKSKKKENLLRLKQQSENRIDRRDSASDEISSPVDLINSASEVDKSVSSSLDTSVEELDSVPSKINKKRSSSKRRSLNSESLTDLDSPNSHTSITNTSRIKRSSLQIDTSPNRSSNERKRKSSTEQSNSKSKKISSSANFEAVLDAVVRGNLDSSMSPDTSVKSKRNQPPVEVN